MTPPSFDDLTDYHRAKIFKAARAWRLENHMRILAATKGVYTSQSPSGASMFNPEKWSSENWIWFSARLASVITKGGIS